MTVVRSMAYTRNKLDNETTGQDVLAAAEGILKGGLNVKAASANYLI